MGVRRERTGVRRDGTERGPRPVVPVAATPPSGPRRPPSPPASPPPSAVVSTRRWQAIAAVGWAVAAALAVRSGWPRPAGAPTPPPNPAVIAREELSEDGAGEEREDLARVDDPGSTIQLGEFSLDVAAAARALVRRSRPPSGFRDDCSGFVSAVYTAAGIPMDGSVAQLYAVAERAGVLHHNPVPTVGDLAFFDNTHDRNGNRRWDDLRTHIAAVVDVEPDGTVVLAHKGSERALIQMNLLPDRIAVHEDGDRLYNSFLRRKSLADGRWELNLTGELWSGFAHVAPEVDWVVP
jgi:hypothetical protein